MTDRRWVYVVIFLVVLCSGLLAASPAGATPAGDAEPGSSEPDQLVAPVLQSGSIIHLDQELGLVPDEPGTIDVVLSYEIPDNVRSLQVELHGDTTVDATDGFDRTGEDTYEWDGRTDSPSIEYRISANVTATGDGPVAAGGRYHYVDTGEWALVRKPRLSHWVRWIATEDMKIDRSTSVRGEGAVGEVMVFLGSHEEFSHAAHDQTFQLVVPEVANLEESPDDIFDSLEHASESIRVGARDERVFVVAVPTEAVEWAVRGLQTGPSDMWIEDDERLDTADNIWLHEYIHTRQDYDTTDDMRWFTEGSATYYAALLTFEQEHIEFQEFRDRLEQGRAPRFEDVRLSEPGSWQHSAEYYVGALVAGELDRHIRHESDSEHHLQNVFKRMNDADGQVSLSDFEGYVRSVGGDDVARGSRTYTTTTERPSVWSAQDHADAFGLTPARFEYELPDPMSPEPYRVSGPYRNRSVAPSDHLEVVPGETLTVDSRVRNAGDTNGTFEAVFRVNGERTHSREDRLEPGESTTVTFEYEFIALGDHTVSVDDESITVTVREPTTPNVTNFEANRTAVEPNGTVLLTVDLHNPASVPGSIDLPITRNGEEIDRRTVRLDADSNRSITIEQTFAEPGEYEFGLGDAADDRVTITVPEEQPGFGAASAGMAVALLSLLVFQSRAFRDREFG